jgi:hypothetical protein
VKLCYTGYIVILVPVYWWQHGPANFLWGSNVALLVTLLGLWLESSLLVSMMALVTLIPEVGWAVDFTVRLVYGPEIVSFRGTRYMFDPALFCWIVLPLSYLVSRPAANINWVFGFIDPPQQWLPGAGFVLFLMALFPLMLFLPTHLLLRRVFR